MRKHTIRLLALLALLMMLPLAALAESFAVVRGGTLNLREYPNTGSRSLGKYGSGAWVSIEGKSASGGWWPVRTMDGRRGYMDGRFLAFASSGNSGTVRYANGGYVSLRKGPSLDYPVVTRVTSGTSITIVDESYEWNYVTAYLSGGTYSGYMHDSLIDKGATAARVTTRNGGKVNVRSGPSSSYRGVGSLRTGTRVRVLLKGSSWSMISGGGLTGFMSNTYLTASSGSSGGGNGGGGGSTSTRIAYVDNPRSTRCSTSGSAPRRARAPSASTAMAREVKVVSYGATWCEVYVGTRHGYMMTRYLNFDGNYLPPTEPVYPTYPSEPSAPTEPNYPTYPSVPSEPSGPTGPLDPSSPTVPAEPTAGTSVTLTVSQGSVGVYNDSSLTSLKASYASGKTATMLQYGDSVCMILVDGGVGYVSTWNVRF